MTIWNFEQKKAQSEHVTRPRNGQYIATCTPRCLRTYEWPFIMNVLFYGLLNECRMKDSSITKQQQLQQQSTVLNTSRKQKVATLILTAY